MRPRPALVAVPLSLLFWGTPLESVGQPPTLGAEVRGRVVDRVTRLPVQGATVAAPEGSVSVLTNDGGLFSLRVSGAPPYHVRIEHLAYRTLSTALEAGGDGPPVVIEVEPGAIELEGLEIFVRGFNERLEYRRNAASGVVHAFDTDALLAYDADEGFELFWMIVRQARPCRGATPDFCILSGGRDLPVVVCIDERRAHAGVMQLGDYRPEEFFAFEVYQRGQVIRAYTHDWVRGRVVSRQLAPASWAC